VLVQFPPLPIIPSSIHVPFNAVSCFAVYAQSLSAEVNEVDAFATLVIVSFRLTFTLDMPGAIGAAAFFDVPQKAKTIHIGKTNIIFFILTVFFIAQKPQPCQKTILNCFYLKFFRFCQPFMVAWYDSNTMESLSEITRKDFMWNVGKYKRLAEQL